MECKRFERKGNRHDWRKRVSDNNIRYMENQLEIIKSNFSYGYERSIAKEVGCSKGTAHNILNNKPASARSAYKSKVLTIATRMANEAIKSSK